MRLLSVAESGGFESTEFQDDTIPPYAILSHTWRTDGGEVTFRDITNNNATIKPGHGKLTFCAKKAARDGLKYFWIDTCCIDKSSSAELQEAINSMFKWYQMARKCYVYLSDVSADENHEPYHALSKLRWNAAFCSSRWFTRGWTLQELLAPALVEFYSKEGKLLGDKKSLEQDIHRITNIPITALRGYLLANFSIDDRLSWAEKRQTSREEDWAYCLLGIFGISIPLLYGEGRQRAIVRLRREIDATIADAAKEHDHVILRNHKTSSAVVMSQDRRYSVASKKRKASSDYDSRSMDAGITDRDASPNEEMHGVLPSELASYPDAQSWLQSFRNRPADQDLHAENELGHNRIKQLVNTKEQSETKPIITTSQASAVGPEDQFPFCKQQSSVPPLIQSYFQESVPADQVHLIIQGLGLSGEETRAETFPRNGTVGMIHDYLREEGFGRLSGFEVQTGQKSYFMRRNMPKKSTVAIEITNGPSIKSFREGYAINVNERFIDFYNSLFAASRQVNIAAQVESISVSDSNDCTSRLDIDFRRMVRVPDDGQTYQLSPMLASYPLFPAHWFASTLPVRMLQKGGVFFGMLQREAFAIAFSSQDTNERQFAMRIFMGGINVLTGEHMTASRLSSTASQQQDYIVVPRQQLLGGYRQGDSVRQFVGMPMGSKYSIEHQLTNSESTGGIQIEVTPLLRQTAEFSKAEPASITQDDILSKKLDICDCAQDARILPGERILMLDHGIYDPDETLGQPTSEENAIEPENPPEAFRPTLLRELYDGPMFERLDLSRSLVIRAVPAIEMRIGPFKNGERMTFYCSQAARMSNIRSAVQRFLRLTLGLRDDYNITLILAGVSYDHDNDTPVSDLKLTTPQQVKVKLEVADEILCGASLDATDQAISGWDLAVAMGGKLQQNIIQDDISHLWNWKAARTFNVQILNMVAFQAVTGLSPPISPLNAWAAASVGIPLAPKTLITNKLGTAASQLLIARSIGEIERERGASSGVMLNGDAIILCVCCETNICDSLFDECGHVFCHNCIRYYMTEKAVTKCGFCLKVCTRVIQFAAPGVAFDKYNNAGRSVLDQHRADLSYHEDGGVAFDSWSMRTLQQVANGNATASSELDDLICYPRKGRMPNRTGALQLLLGQVMSQNDIYPNLPIGYLINNALEKNNVEAWKMLVPMYEVLQHAGLAFAREHGMDIMQEFQSVRPYYKPYEALSNIVTAFGIQTAQLLIKLDILKADLSIDNVERVIGFSRIGEFHFLRLLGLDLAWVNSRGETMLHLVEDRNMTELLCTAGASILALDDAGNTPVLKAAACCRKDVLRVLLRQDGVQTILDERNKHGKTAVHYAQKDRKILAMLIAAGANPTLSV